MRRDADDLRQPVARLDLSAGLGRISREGGALARTCLQAGRLQPAGDDVPE